MSRGAQKFKEAIIKYVKNEHVNFDVDTFSSVDIQKYCDILSDFVYLNSISIHSGRCSESLRNKNKVSMKKLEFKNSSLKAMKANNLWHQIRHQEKQATEQEDEQEEDESHDDHGKEENTDMRVISQNAGKNQQIIIAISKNLINSNSLQELSFVDIKMTQKSWYKLGAALGEASSLLSLSFTACNLNQGRSMQDLMSEMKRNDSIQKLSFNDSDLNDIHGIFILEMIKTMAQRRD